MLFLKNLLFTRDQLTYENIHEQYEIKTSKFWIIRKRISFLQF